MVTGSRRSKSSRSMFRTCDRTSCPSVSGVSAGRTSARTPARTHSVAIRWRTASGAEGSAIMACLTLSASDHRGSSLIGPILYNHALRGAAYPAHRPAARPGAICWNALIRAPGWPPKRPRPAQAPACLARETHHNDGVLPRYGIARGSRPSTAAEKAASDPYRARYRRRRLEQSGANDHQQGTGEDRFAQPQQVRQTGENPHAPIQAKDAEDKTMQWQYPEQMPLRALPEFRRNLAVKTGYVGKQPDGGNCAQIKNADNE